MKEYHKSKKYDSKWIEDNWMGPHPLWLLEELCENLDLRPGMKVLDMGCGKGITSVFLAKEYGVTVFANDLWISATDNLKRFEEAGVADRVFPINAEAHALPYANEFFDVAISIDSYHYYGTDEMYFPEVYSKLVRHGGQFGIVCPGLVREFESGYPQTLKEHWPPDFFTFHSKDWWKRHWEKVGTVDITACYNMPNPKDVWYSWANRLLDEQQHSGDKDLLDADIDNDIALVVMTAIKKEGRIF